MDAREYFEAVSQAVRQHRAAELVLQFGEPRSGSGGVSSSAVSDPTARAAEAAARAKRTMADTEEVIGGALARIDGLRMVVGRRADVLEMRYIDLMAWPEIAEGLGVSPSTARRWHDVACDWADAHGWAHVAEGVGGAEA